MRRLGDRPGFKASASGPLGGPRLTSVLMALAAMALIVTGSAGADQSYTDPQGDAGVGTDIVAVTVRNDAAGNLSFQVGSASPIVSNHAIAIFVNADRNKSTGASSTGDDFVMFGGPATGVAFAAWNGSQFVATNPPSYHVGAATSNVTDFRISKADLGNTSGFDFAVISVSEDPPDPNLHFWDYAPNAGVYTYTLTTPAPPPSTNPPPAPKPPPTSRPDPNKLPTIFGPSARSRRTPNTAASLLEWREGHARCSVGTRPTGQDLTQRQKQPSPRATSSIEAPTRSTSRPTFAPSSIASTTTINGRLSRQPSLSAS